MSAKLESYFVADASQMPTSQFALKSFKCENAYVEVYGPKPRKGASSAGGSSAAAKPVLLSASQTPHPSARAPMATIAGFDKSTATKRVLSGCTYDGDEGGWYVAVTGNSCFNMGSRFLRVGSVSFDGTERTQLMPKSFHIRADDIEGDWDPALQLGLFKIIKDCVAGTINLKHSIHRILHEPPCFCPMHTSPPPVVPSTMAEVEDLFGGLLQDRADFVLAFKRWLLVDRASYLPEDLLFVTIDSSNIHIRASLESKHSTVGTGNAPAARSTSGSLSTMGGLTSRKGSVPSARFSPMSRQGSSRALPLDLSLDIRCKTFCSSNVPHQFSFGGTNVLFNGQPLVAVDYLIMGREGLFSSVSVLPSPGGPKGTDLVSFCDVMC